MDALIHLLVWILIIGAVFAILYWAIQQVPLPPPLLIVVKVVMALILVIICLELLLPLAGEPGSFRLR